MEAEEGDGVEEESTLQLMEVRMGDLQDIQMGVLEVVVLIPLLQEDLEMAVLLRSN